MFESIHSSPVRRKTTFTGKKKAKQFHLLFSVKLMPVKCIHRTCYTLEIDTETGAVETAEINIKETNKRE